MVPRASAVTTFPSRARFATFVVSVVETVPRALAVMESPIRARSWMPVASAGVAIPPVPVAIS